MAKLFGRAIINQTVTVYSGGTAFVSDEIVGNGEGQQVAHGLPYTPTKVIVLPSGLPGGSVWEYEVSSINETYLTVTATLGVSYRVFAWTGTASSSPLRLTAPDNGVWELTANADGVINTFPAPGLAGVPEVVLAGEDGSRWLLEVGSDGILTTTRINTSISAARMGRYLTGNMPEPSMAWRGTFICVYGPGVDEEVWCCRQTAVGDYEWVKVTLTPPV